MNICHGEETWANHNPSKASSHPHSHLKTRKLLFNLHLQTGSCSSLSRSLSLKVRSLRGAEQRLKLRSLGVHNFSTAMALVSVSPPYQRPVTLGLQHFERMCQGARLTQAGNLPSLPENCCPCSLSHWVRQVHKKTHNTQRRWFLIGHLFMGSTLGTMVNDV